MDAETPQVENNNSSFRSQEAEQARPALCTHTHAHTHMYTIIIIRKTCVQQGLASCGCASLLQWNSAVPVFFLGEGGLHTECMKSAVFAGW